MGKKQKLNRGIEDLFSDNVFEETEKDEKPSSEISKVRISLLEPNKDQPRNDFDEEALAELANSIRNNGVLQPILVRPLENGGYQIVAGERRWRASRIAGLTEVPVYIRELSDMETMQLALIENIQREDLSPLEEALAYQNLMDTYTMTQQEVATAVGKSRSAVANALRLLTLEDAVKQYLEDGELTAGHAKMLAALDTERQLKLADQAVKHKWSVRQLEDYISLSANEKSENQRKENAKKIRDLFKYERPFLKEFETAVNSSSNVKAKIKDDKKGGAVLNLEIGKDVDIQALLTALGEVLEKY